MNSDNSEDYLESKMSEKDVIKETRPRMETVIEDFRRKLATVRTGRAAVSLLGFGDGRLLRHHDAAQPDGFGACSRTADADCAAVGPDPSARCRESDPRLPTWA